MRNLPDSTYGMYERFKWEMHAKQECVDSSNYFNDTVFLTPVYLSFYNQTSCLIDQSGAFFDAILFTICTSYSQSNESIEEKAVYMNNIHSKTIQWETWKKSCCIIKDI